MLAPEPRAKHNRWADTPAPIFFEQGDQRCTFQPLRQKLARYVLVHPLCLCVALFQDFIRGLTIGSSPVPTSFAWTGANAVRAHGELVGHFAQPLGADLRIVSNSIGGLDLIDCCPLTVFRLAGGEHRRSCEGWPPPG
uniref:hypothetical protein n=1 Tax=Sphingomonas sp. PL-96 TaxID=2887201 RepID=UPI001E5C90A0|nr:hypothetical protein [Sphingomonas sp. PL-96]